jgi:hypothetical protein
MDKPTIQDIESVLNENADEIYKILFKKLYLKVYYQNNASELKEKSKTNYQQKIQKKNAIIDAIQKSKEGLEKPTLKKRKEIKTINFKI